MDRGFLDGEWITQFAVAQRERDNCCEPHPTRKNQKIYQIKESELDWPLC